MLNANVENILQHSEPCETGSAAKHRVIVAAFVGLDGIRDGWVAVYLGGGADQRFAYGGSVTDLLAAPFDRAMIDMPIGLPERGYRQCDVDARKLVGARVFLGARQGIWNFKTLNEANTYY